jgi:hypothetical protein
MKLPLSEDIPDPFDLQTSRGRSAWEATHFVPGSTARTGKRKTRKIGRPVLERYLLLDCALCDPHSRASAASKIEDIRLTSYLTDCPGQSTPTRGEISEHVIEPRRMIKMPGSRAACARHPGGLSPLDR